MTCRWDTSISGEACGVEYVATEPTNKGGSGMRAGVLALAYASLLAGEAGGAASATTHDHYLFVWAGDQAGKGNDFLTVIDADPASISYGKLVTSIGTDQKSELPHHTEYQMPASGMLFANDHDGNRTFIFDLRHPLKPSIAASFKSLAGYKMAHSFVRLPNGHVLAAFQYADHGNMAMDASSGGLVEIDETGKAVRSVSSADPSYAEDGLLPYSLAVLPTLDRVLVTNSPMADTYLVTSDTYQIFRLSDLKLLGTYRLDPGPRLNGHISPEEPRVGPDGAVYVDTLSCGIQRVSGLDQSKPTVKLVYQLPGGWCGGVPSVIGRYIVLSAPAIHGFIVLDLADGEHPREVSRVTISEKFAPHWTAWDPATHRLVVTSGKSGDRTYLLTLNEATGVIGIDTNFRDRDGQVGFSFASRAWPHGWTGEGKPHGAVFAR